jgi:inosine-uridine nucleoside N-ribohydrolase
MLLPRYLSFTAFLAAAALLLAPLSGHAQKAETRVIYDTDMGPMTDDVAALSMLHALSDNGEAEILATIASNRHSNVAQVLDIFNTFYGHPNIPVGVPGGIALDIEDAPDVCCRGGWTDYLVREYPADIRSNDVVPTATELYRRVLSQQPDASVTIITVGFLTNLSDLLASGPDQYSELNGSDLVEKKVKRLVSMAGTFTGPVGNPDHPQSEYNLRMDALSSKHVFEDWPTEIIYSGYALGESVHTRYQREEPQSNASNPVSDVFRMVSSGKEEEASFDQTAVLVAVRGAEPYFDLVEGRIVVNWDGSNSWNSDGEGQYYLELNEEHASQTEQEIETLMVHEPPR